MDDGECKWEGSKTPKPPTSWWKKYEYFDVEGYGTFDKDHLERGWETAQEIYTQLLGQGDWVELEKEIGAGYADHIAKYSVSGEISPELMYGIYTDYEIGFEEHQGRGWKWFSAFSPEDLPSDHIGFWAYINGYEKSEIPFVLERLGNVSPTLPSALAVDVITSVGPTIIIPFPKNYEFLPMAPLTYSGEGMSGITWQNVSWPSWLEIVPIPSGPDTWQRVE